MPFFIIEQRIEMTSHHREKPPERNMLLNLSLCQGFCWMEIPRLDLYLPAVFRRIQQFSREKNISILKLTFKTEHVHGGA